MEYWAELSDGTKRKTNRYQKDVEPESSKKNALGFVVKTCLSTATIRYTTWIGENLLLQREVSEWREGSQWMGTPCKGWLLYPQMSICGSHLERSFLTRISILTFRLSQGDFRPGSRHRQWRTGSTPSAIAAVTLSTGKSARHCISQPSKHWT